MVTLTKTLPTFNEDCPRPLLVYVEVHVFDIDMESLSPMDLVNFYSNGRLDFIIITCTSYREWYMIN